VTRVGLSLAGRLADGQDDFARHGRHSAQRTAYFANESLEPVCKREHLEQTRSFVRISRAGARGSVRDARRRRPIVRRRCREDVRELLYSRVDPRRRVRRNKEISQFTVLREQSRARSLAASVLRPFVVRGARESCSTFFNLVARAVSDDHKFAGLDLRFIRQDAIFGNTDT
jgi:hypothetical protein